MKGSGGPAAAPGIGRVLQDSSLYLLGNVLTRVISLFTIPFYSHYLSPAQYGLIELIELSTQAIAIAFGLQVVGSALGRLFHDEKTRDGELSVVSTALISAGVFSAVTTGIAVALAGPIGRALFHTDEWTLLLRTAFLAMFLSEMAEVMLVYERTRSRALFFLGYSLLTTCGMLGLNILFIGVLDFGVWGFVSSKLIVIGLSCTFLLVRARREVGWRWNAAYVPRLVRFGAPLVVSSLAYFAVHFSDRFFLSAAVPLSELGRYAMAYQFAIMVSALVGDSFKKSWDVTLYRYTDRADWRDQFAGVASYLTFVLFTTGLGIALFAPELLRVMVPSDYFPPPLLLPVLVASYLAREVGDFFRTLLLINKRSGTVVGIAVASAVANLLLNALLIPAYGLYGAAVATLITWLGYMVTCWLTAHAEHRLPVRVSAYLRVAVLLTGVYALSEATRGAPLLLQGAMDGAWLLLFCVLCFFVFFGPVERRGIAGLAGTAAVWALTRGGPETPASHGPARVLMVSARASCREAELSRHGIPVTALAELQPERGPGWLVGAGGVALGTLERLTRTDHGLSWLPIAFTSASGLVDSATVLFSTPAPPSGHLAASALKQRFGLAWVAELGSGPPDIGLERLLLSAADTLVVVDAAGAAGLRARHPGATVPLLVAPSAAELARVIAGLSARDAGAVQAVSAL